MRIHIPHIGRKGALGLLGAGLLLGGTAGIVLSVHDVNLLELQGGVVYDGGAGSTFDWANLFDATGTPKTPPPTGFVQSVFAADYATPDTSYHQPSDTDLDNVNTWGCVSIHNPTSKDNILNAYAALFRDSDGHLIFYGASERESNNGTSYAGFWLLQSGAACSGGAFSGTHTNGDLLILANYVQGGSTAEIQAYSWSSGSLTPVTTGGQCVLTGAGDYACGQPNTGVGTATGAFTPPWTSQSARHE